MAGPSGLLGIRLDDNAGKIRNQPVNLVDLFAPPFGDASIRGIESVEASDHFRTADVNGDCELDTPGTKHIGNASELREKIVLNNLRIGVNAVDRAPVDSDGSEQARVLAGARQVRADAAVLKKYGRPRVAALDTAVEVVPLVCPTNGCVGLRVSCNAETFSFRAILLSSANTP